MAPSVPTFLPAVDVVHVVTTTIFSPSPSSTLDPSPSRSNAEQFPIASIVGGSIAGILLAICSVVGWRLWGRSIKKQDALKRKEEMSIYTTLENTRKNALLSARTWKPIHAFPQERKIKFAPSQASSEKLVDPIPPSSRKLRHAAPSIDKFPVVGLPPDDASHHLQVPSLQFPAQSLQVPASLAHKASNASSLSMYSTQSGEDHQTRPPAVAIPRIFDPRRISYAFTRVSRNSQYSNLGDIDEVETPHNIDEKGAGGCLNWGLQTNGQSKDISSD